MPQGAALAHVRRAVKITQKGGDMRIEDYEKLVPFGRYLGIKLTHVSAEEIRGSMEITADLCNHTPNVHGGAIMSLGDALGAVGAFQHIPDGSTGTTTIESKTNFIKMAEQGDVLVGVARPLSIGRRLSVWQTDITRSDGKRVAQVTQTQIYL